MMDLDTMIFIQSPTAYNSNADGI